MTSYVYDGISPALMMWILVGLTIALLACFIYEETKHADKYTKGSWWRIGVLTLLWGVALTAVIVTDSNRDGGLEDTNQKVADKIESTGLEIIGGQVNATPGSISVLQVQYKQNEPTSCEVYAPPVNAESMKIDVLCGNTADGQTPKELIESYEKNNSGDDETKKETPSQDQNKQDNQKK